MKGVGIYANYLLVIFCCHGCGACRKTSFRLKIFRFCANTCQKFLKIYLYSSNFLTSSRTKSENFATKADFPTYSKKSDQIRFVEVKSVSREIIEGNVTRETSGRGYEPEDEIHPWKQKRLKRAIQSYILENKLEDVDWQFDVLGVFVDDKTK